MELRDIKALLALMSEHGLVELEIEDKRGKIRLVRGVVGLHYDRSSSAAVAVAPSVAPPGSSEATRKGSGRKSDEPPTASPGPPFQLEPNQKMVQSPMVGTFFRAPAPDAAPFVEEGSYVRKGQPLCIIEAMKMMNEIEADTAGRVVKILVENGRPVEYGQPMMILETVG